MKRKLIFFFIFLIVSCGRRHDTGSRIISVSIAPFKYFVEEIADDHFEVNVMVPAGANPHIYEPSPDQISKLYRSIAYISNGCLGFEIAWLDRFYEINRDMKKLTLADNIDLIMPEYNHGGKLYKIADPHYWLSPVCAVNIASSVNEFLAGLDPQNRQQYDLNYRVLYKKIMEVDSAAKELSSSEGKRAFMIYHPTLGYLARDYGLEEIAVEVEGKEPTPSRFKEMIDRARKDNLKVILVQKEYDIKNVQTVIDETGARINVIDPLSEDWYASTTEIIRILKESFAENPN
jgi:zinc transport system substrate-binding protein